MPATIVPIVEGQGEVKAVQSMIYRVLHERLEVFDIQVSKPKRLKRNQVLAELPRFLEYAASQPGCGAIIILMDADDDCPRDLACAISTAAAAAGSAYPVAVVCPNTEYEAWFIASIESIRGQPIGYRQVVVRADAECPEDLESIRGAKGWLSRQMPDRMVYKPTQDQEPLTHLIDLDLAEKRSRSFERFCHAVGELVAAIRSGDSGTTPGCAD